QKGTGIRLYLSSTGITNGKFLRSNGDTPLRFADRNGHIDTVKALINYVTKLEAADLYVSQKNLEEKKRID
ncbi:hypothetical protein RYE99_02100, partial [Wolbachia endosymbiont of Drosophila seguyi]|uniref:hypothetical protein n=1 Tax=Wolbachia endosymbiont of Drosophila seguyi TaxID=3002581 RepID=UPI0023A9CAB9